MLSRRRFVALSAVALGGAVATRCGGSGRPASVAVEQLREADNEAPPDELPAAPTVTPSPEPAVVFPAGASERLLLEGTAYETPLTITHSGEPGPVLIVLGGVHGNEPGGRLAAEEVAAWSPVAGSLAVIPRANAVAIERWERTSDDLGDLNRLYPGNPESDLPMERLAAQIVALGKELRATVLLDLHESWIFYAERQQDGPAFIGQTVTSGVGPMAPQLGHAVIARVNSGIAVERDLLIARDGSAFRAPDGTAVSGLSSRGRSSLSLGGHVPGLTPILAEMGQENQAVDRRVELHLSLVRATMDELAM